MRARESGREVLHRRQRHSDGRIWSAKQHRRQVEFMASANPSVASAPLVDDETCDSEVLNGGSLGEHGLSDQRAGAVEFELGLLQEALLQSSPADPLRDAVQRLWMAGHHSAERDVS